MYTILLLALINADPKPKQQCECARTALCECFPGTCWCAACFASADAKPDAKKPYYHWQRFSDGDMTQVACMKDGKQCGVWSFKTSMYTPLGDDGQFGKCCDAPLTPPPDYHTGVVAAASTTSSSAQSVQYYYSDSPFQSGGGCASGSCSGGSGAGRFRR